MIHYVLAFDPSGSFQEGKGVTGWCLVKRRSKKSIEVIKSGVIRAKDYNTAMDYYIAHLKLIDKMDRNYNDLHTYIKRKLHIVIEDYRLYASKADCQINSRMETCQLIGILKYYCYTKNLHYTLQMAGEVKTRWTDDRLVNKGIELPVTNERRHIKDAIRHAIHFIYFKLGE